VASRQTDRQTDRHTDTQTDHTICEAIGNDKCADTIGTVLVPRAKIKYIFQIKYTEAILSNRTWKISWFEITKVLIAV